MKAVIFQRIQLVWLSIFPGVFTAVMDISRTWEGHLYGEFKLSANTATSGWRVNLVFSLPISNLQTDDDIDVVHVRDGVEWSVSGKSSWSELGESQYVPINIEADYDFYDAEYDDIWGTAMVEGADGDEDYKHSVAEPVIFLGTTQSEFITQTFPASTTWKDDNLDDSTTRGTPVPGGTTISPQEASDFTEVWPEQFTTNSATTLPEVKASQTTAAATTTSRLTTTSTTTSTTTVTTPETTKAFQGNPECDRLVTVKQPPGSPRKYDYPRALAYSILFYEAQRSGKLPSNSRVPWRGDSALDDGYDNGLDLSGGWYDAGDNVKFGFPMASSTTLLLWGLLQWKDAYSATGQLDGMYDCVKWPLDYFIKCHTAPNELYVQVGDADEDHQYWGRPEDMFMYRPSFIINETLPGSDVAAETAAAMAAGSIVFRDRDPKYAELLLRHAEELYDFADRFRGLYTDSVPEASVFYESSHYFDELAWAACWLYKATWREKYLTMAEDLYPAAVNMIPWAFSWDDKKIGVEVMLWNLTQNRKYLNDVEDALTSWLPGGGRNYTTKGLAYLHHWGSLRYAENAAFIALLASDYGISPDVYRPWAMDEMHYALGDTGRSFVVGFGENYPKNPHHRASSCPDMPAPCGWETYNTTSVNPQPLCGALVGGPDEFDFYKDDRKDYISNEVACDYNAGYQSALAGLIHLSITQELPPY